MVQLLCLWFTLANLFEVQTTNFVEQRDVRLKFLMEFQKKKQNRSLKTVLQIRWLVSALIFKVALRIFLYQTDLYLALQQYIAIYINCLAS